MNGLQRIHWVRRVAGVGLLAFAVMTPFCGCGLQQAGRYASESEQAPRESGQPSAAITSVQGIALNARKQAWYLSDRGGCMISARDRESIVRIAKGYHASRVVLFGSSATGQGEARDIDLGVLGVDPRLFFKFYADLIFSLSKPVDVVDLSRESMFTRIIAREGIPLYG